MSIKGLLGFCECKGCWNRRDFDMDIVAHFENGKKVTKTVRICEQHAIEAVKGGTLKNVIFEDNTDLSVPVDFCPKCGRSLNPHN